MIERLKILQANKGQFAQGSELFEACSLNSTLQNEINYLSKVFLGRTVSGCNNCYMDAYLELINLNIEKAMKKIECSFKLLAGKLLHDVVNYDNDLLCSNANITDDLALYHLKTNPTCKKFFQALPENVDELIEAYKLPGEVPAELELTEEEKAAQAEAETKVVAEIAELLKAKTTKTAIKAKYKEVKTVGTKNLTQRFLIELIDRAETSLEETPEKTLEETKEVTLEETKELTEEEKPEQITDQAV